MKNPFAWAMNNKVAILWWLVPMAIFSLFYGITLTFPLNDPDLWWHVKTGEYIITNWSVPDIDPFAYTTNVPLDVNKLLGLRAQWLGQVILFEVSNYFGLSGLGYFRNFLVMLPMLFVYIWIVSRGAGHLRAIAVTLLSLYMYSYQLFYSFERPQGMSFALIALTLILLDRVREKSYAPGKDWSYFALPVLMVLWANIHAGYLVGIVVLSIFFGSELVTMGYAKLRKSTFPVSGKPFYIVVAASVLATMFTPNGTQLFMKYAIGTTRLFVRDVASASTQLLGGQQADTGTWVENIVLEFRPLKFFYTELGYTWLTYYWGLVVIALVFLLLKYILRRRFDLAEFTTFAVIVFSAEQHARILMFSIAVIPVIIGKSIIEIKDLQGKLFMGLRLAIYSAMIVVTFGFGSYMNGSIPLRVNFTPVPEWVSPWYPLDMVKFIRYNKIAGPMYNYYTWGGFFIWGLYPDYKVFIDGRAMDDLVNRTADSILKTFPAWQSKLDVYGINFIAIPLIYRESGHIIPLAPALEKDPNWKLIYVRNNGALFVRDVPKNAALIKKYNIDKMSVYKEIISVENMFLMGAPNHPVYNMAKADAYYMLGRYEEAKPIYERFPELAGPQLQSLKEMGK